MVTVSFSIFQLASLDITSVNMQPEECAEPHGRLATQHGISIHINPVSGFGR
jgi:hypothetical protein